ncbi:MAG: GNAT family N-acetyltransferase [Pseudomonadota bacterium]
MTYKLYRPEELSAEQWQVYAALRDARSIYDDPFFDPDFARLVGEVRDDTRIGFASDKNGVFAVWPLHLRPGNWARPIGSPFSDWNGPILAEDATLSAQEILAGFDISGMTTQGYQPVSYQRKASFERIGANMTDISVGWDAYFADQQKQWPKHFKKMRRLYRNVDRDFSGYRLEWDDRAASSFDQLVTLKREQYARTGYFDVLSAPWTRDLFDRLKSFQGPRLRTRLSSLFYGDALAAAEFNLQSDTVLHGWITAFDQAYAKYSPGNMLTQGVLERMPQEGLTLYDAGPGADHYKRHYANMQFPIESGVLEGSERNVNVSRMAGQAWRFGEQVMPKPASAIMARARRRMDQIASVDTTSSGRANGLFSALNNRPV